MHSFFLLWGLAGKKPSRLQDTEDAFIYTCALSSNAFVLSLAVYNHSSHVHLFPPVYKNISKGVNC